MMLALALLLTLFVASTNPSARFWPPFWPLLPLPPSPPPLDDAVVVLPIVEVMVRSSRALTVSWPLALTVVSSIVAVALDGFCSPKALAIVGEPSRASMALNRTFCDSQPMVLKASVTPTAVFPEPLPPLPPPPLPLPLDEDDAVAALVVMAVSVAVFSASTVTPPMPVPVPVVVTTLLLRWRWRRSGRGWCQSGRRWRGVTRWSSRTWSWEWTKSRRFTSLVVVAVSVAISLACTSTLPPVAESVV